MLHGVIDPLQHLSIWAVRPELVKTLPYMAFLYEMLTVSPGGDMSLLPFVQDEYCFYNGKTHWEPSVSSARRFVPFAVCVVSRFPYYNSLKDCLSW